jgi:hypothetical protein
MSSGIPKGWEMLIEREPPSICKKALAGFDETAGLYILKSFGMDILISLRHKTISGTAPESTILLQRLGYFSQPAILWYLMSAKDIPLAGQLIKPVNLKGGQLFFRGTHELPLNKIAERYCHDTSEFLARGKRLGAEVLQYGDASVRLFPLPRVPVIILLWEADDEFPARADLLFDASCEHHLPLDMIWSTAMMSLLLML